MNTKKDKDILSLKSRFVFCEFWSLGFGIFNKYFITSERNGLCEICVVLPESPCSNKFFKKCLQSALLYAPTVIY